jgi:hypothetical protein
MSRKARPYPQFRDEAEERRFWESHDSSDYVDWSNAERERLPNLERSTTPSNQLQRSSLTRK